MDNKLISIILPSYNMEKYLSRCVDSLIVNRFLGKYEIVIVNDGSKDRTLEIANEYKERYNDTISIVNKNNGHYGSTVNAGLKVAKGKYFKVLDSDDWFNNTDFEKLLERLDKGIDVDVIFTHWSINNTKDNTITRNNGHNNIYDTVVNIDDIITDSHQFSFYAFYGIAYRTGLLREINYHQTEGICYTDIEYSYYPILEAQTAIFYDLNIYQYFIGRDGQTITEESIKRNVSHFYKVTERMVNSFEYKESAVKQFFQVYQFKLITYNLYFSCLCLNKKNVLDKIDLRFIDNKLKKIQPEVYNYLGGLKCLRIRYVSLWRKTGQSFYYLYRLRTFLMK